MLSSEQAQACSGNRSLRSKSTPTTEPMNCSWKKRIVKVTQEDCLQAKLVTPRQERPIEVLSGFSKNNGLFAKSSRRKVLQTTYADTSIWSSLEGVGVAGQ